MSSFREVTFGERLFSKIDKNTYLRKIYQNILYNYSKRLFQVEALEDKPVSLEDALTFADILSKLYGTGLSDEHKTRAQEMVAFAARYVTLKTKRLNITLDRCWPILEITSDSVD